jgi:16S rRNA (guanine(966)-N(2))-methyltransferase RsmD
MRIISGKWKGRRFYLPKGVGTRPTSEMIREALFSMFRNEVSGAVVLDLFAGSASFALEALSRGAKHAIICDNNKKCIAEIKRSLESYNADKDEYTLMASDFRHVIRKVQRMGTGIDICYIDPPYSSEYYMEALDLAGAVLSPDGAAILEHSFRDKMPGRMGSLKRVRDRKYGGTLISVYRKETM